MLRERSASTLDSPTRKKPSVTLTARPASGVPRACSFDFIRMPGTLLTPPPAKSGGRIKVSSAVWLAGSEVSVLRRNDIVILNLRSGMSMSARTAISGFWPAAPLICSVRQITEPTYCLPLGSAGSSSYSTTRCATGATGSSDAGWPTRSGIFGFASGAVSLGASTTVCDGLNRPLTPVTTDLPHRIAAPTRISTTPIAIALLNGNTAPLRARFFGSRSAAATREPKKRARSGAVFPFKSAIAIGVVLILVGAAILWGKSVVTGVSGLFKPSQTVVEAPKDTAPLAKPKIPDRVGQPASEDPVAPVAQRVVLYDEDPADPKGKQYVGSVIWRTEQIKGAAGQKPDIAVRADIDIPDRKFKMTMSFRRNTDTSLPASHTAELTFILPPDFAGGGVSNVPGILMKSNEQARGTPLAGLAVKVTDGFFLVGLSNVDADRSRNIQLLKERSWFDVPLVYVNQRRAIIAIEKGAPGERAFNDAFAAWGE